jgi:hypothetical protein
MRPSQLFSRRKTADKVDFRPIEPTNVNTPYAQIQKLISLLEAKTAPVDDLDLEPVLSMYRQFKFRKVFGATRQEFLDTPTDEVDYLIALDEVDRAAYRGGRGA